MPDKQLVFTIPEPNKDGTCNGDCPFHRYTHGELAMCYFGFHKSENFEIYPDKGCPQSKSKSKDKSKDKITQDELETKLNKGATFIDVIEGENVNRYFNDKFGLNYTTVRKAALKDLQTLPELIDCQNLLIVRTY